MPDDDGADGGVLPESFGSACGNRDPSQKRSRLRSCSL